MKSMSGKKNDQKKMTTGRFTTLILAFVFLHEQVTTKSIIGCVLIGAGTLLMVL